MSVIVATTRVASSTGGGNQNITTADCGGLTPKAAIFIATRTIVDGPGYSDNAVMSIGFAVSSSERLVTALSDRNGVNPSQTYRRMTEDECVMILDPTDGSIDGEADFSAWITNGCTINWGNAPAAAYLLTVVFFCGTDVSAHVDTFQAPAVVDTAVDVTAPGFEPDVVLMATHRSEIDDSTYTTAALSWGCVVNDGSETQYSVNMAGQNNASPVQNAENSRSNRVAMNIHSVGEYESNEVDSFDANGFSVYTRNLASAQNVGYLALNFNGAADVWLGDISSPTSTGDDADANPGFTPQAIIIGIGRDPSFSTADDNDNQQTDVYSAGVGVATTTAEYSNVISSEDAATTMSTKSMSDNQVIHAPEHDGGTSADLQATGPSGAGSFDANGFTLNYTQVDAGNNIALWALAIEEAPSISPSSSISPSESPSISPSASVSPSSSESPSESPSVSPSSSVSLSSSESASASPSEAIETVQDVVLRIFCGSPSSSESPSESPSLSPSSSASPSTSPSESPSISPSSSASPSESPSISPSSSESPSISPSSSTSPSESPSESPSASSSESPSISPSASVSPSASPSESPSISPSSSASPSASPSESPSASPSESPSISPSSSVSPSVSPSESPSISPSSSISPSESPSESPSISPSSSVSPSESASESPSSSVSPSESSSASPSSSESPSESLTTGDTYWGHDTGVIEENVRDFAGNWTGTGDINGAGDAETICLNTGESMLSEVVYTDEYTVTLVQNVYDPSGDDVDMDYRHGATEGACLAAGWNDYTVPFVSLGYVQIRITSTL